MTTISARRAVVGGRVADGLLVELDGPTIIGVAEGAGSAPAADVTVEWLTAGLIDLQVNGIGGTDLVDADPAGFATVARLLARRGTTAFCPTAITAPLPVLTGFVERVGAAMAAADEHGAELLGAHLEGPFLAPQRVGAHRAEAIALPDERSVDALVAASATGALAMLTLAPEREGAVEAIRRLSAAGVLVSIGHSDATAAQAEVATEAGARMVTHLYNAQRPFHHRDPGVIGRALIDERLSLGLIADLHHVAREALLLVFRAAPGRVVLVSDVVADHPGHVASDPPTLADGTLAGAAATLERAVRNLVDLGVDIAEVIAAATATPARTIGRADLGDLRPGMRADLVAWSDDFHVERVWRAGREITG